jgi:hypothetical protein
MKFTPLSLVLAATLAMGSITVPTYSMAAGNGAGAGEGQDYRSADDYCRHQKKHGQHVGTILGVIGGAIIGSNLAAHSGGRAGGAVLGAAAGGVIGSNIGRSSAKCDGGNAYWSEDSTYGYRDQAYYHGGGYYDDDWYDRHRCRWAQDYDGSYVRVCPDNRGYYRVTN